jgi:RNA polymerase sigma factor (sigma-70 family)
MDCPDQPPADDTAPEAYAEDFALAQAALSGDAGAAAEIESRFRGMLVRVLIARDVAPLAAEDVVADMISECFGARKSGTTGKALLASYAGKSALSTWLVRAAWNKWIDSQRRLKFRGELPDGRDDGPAGDPFDRIPDEGPLPLESDLAQLMRDAVSAGFASLDPEVLLMLKLIYVHRVSQTTVARMWGWNQTRVSRAMTAAREQIMRTTMDEVKRRDPALELEWDDFKELCQLSSEPLF